MNILLITEQREGKWNKTSFETLAAAQQIANETKGRLIAAAIGKGVAALAGELVARAAVGERRLAVARQACEFKQLLDLFFDRIARFQ